MIALLDRRLDAFLDALPAGFVEALIVLAVGIAVLTGSALLYSTLASLHRRRARRLARVSGADDARRSAAAEAARRGSLRSADHAPQRGILRFLPRRDLLRLRLQRAGFSGHPAGYLAASAGTALAATLGLLLSGMVPPLACPILGLGLGLLLPHGVVGWFAGRREKAFLKNLPEGIDIIVRGLKAGLPVSESMAAVGREAAEPVAGLFRQIRDLVRIGHPLEIAIERTARRMAVPELRFLAITMAVQKETGGNLTETLQNLAEILRKRRQMTLKIRAVSSEARASAYILGSLPFVMFAIIYLVNQGYIMELFTDSRGHIMIGIGLGSIAAGVAVMAKMVRFEI